MLRSLLYAIGIGYIFRRLSGNRRYGRGVATRW